ncbi:uncharacterized protein DSM5745_05719 [Aspergillus mulundensis]|uniref:Uncharacterized protein n=1 Tax=Aspergillus mulundensis TaxID=1810919 RepID=A0A3D8RXS7_9EURO|nr:hypothetical protein DSM5745_05719 [Aspergillus mulundensis]RDW78867.1 hypothetical protein DSM5745_05719 [Aspergillus mulundensis]
MPTQRLARAIAYIATPTIATIYGVHLGLAHLETIYPALPPAAAGSEALRTPAKPSQHCAYVDIYAARIPLRALQAQSRCPDPRSNNKTALEEAWARSVLSSQLLRTESSLIGLFTKAHYDPGDLGQDGFSPDAKDRPRALLNGALTVQREPRENGNGLLVSWSMPDAPRLFFERIAAWGYPWRLMSGGRHEMSVSEPFRVQGGGEMVEVRFSAAHDYEVVLVEGALDEQKILPAWAVRLHRGYARLILHLAAREVQGGLG